MRRRTFAEWYRQLASWLDVAERDSDLPSLIKVLEKEVDRNPGFLSELFLARAYAADKRWRESNEVYQRLLENAKPWHGFSNAIHDEAAAVANALGEAGAPSAPETTGSHATNTSVPARSRRQPTHPRKANARTDPTENVAEGGVRKSGRSGKDAKRAASLPTPAGLPRQISYLLQRGELELALNALKEAFVRDNTAPYVIETYTDVLRQLGRFAEADTLLDQSIPLFSGHRRLSLLTRRAHNASSERDWQSAAAAWARLAEEETRKTARRFAKIELARMYLRLGREEDARPLLDSLVMEDPLDLVAGRLRERLETGGEKDVEPADEADADLSAEPVELVSPMLRRDVEGAVYTDELIIKNGNRPEVRDAARLLESARKSQSSEFGERFPLFLEAAKAFSELNVGSYRPEDFHIALARYATLKGSAVVSDLRRSFAIGRSNLHELGRMRDTACSYILESLALQTAVAGRYAAIAPTNYLRAQLACALRANGLPVPSEIFDWRLEQLLRTVSSNEDDEIVRIGYESSVAWGAAIARYWNKFPPRRSINAILLEVRPKAYAILGTISDKKYPLDMKPGEVLKDAIITRRRRIQRSRQGVCK